MLQKYGGSIQQGFYGFAFGISNMSMFIVSTIFLLFTREVSELVGQNDIKAIAKLFDAYVPTLYAIVSFFSCFLFFHADNVITLLGGEGYYAASLALKVLAMYPLVSTFSMMSGSLIYATERTVIFRNISFILAPIGAFISAILISPIAGINLGAAGLAIKNISIEFISVIVILFLNSRFLKISFRKYFFHIIYVPVIFLICAGASTYLVSSTNIVKQSGVLMDVITSGIVYSAIFVTVIYFYPKLIFKERREIIEFVKTGISKLQKKGSTA
jgi:O-antigen/teichoic acid export membrane protein